MFSARVVFSWMAIPVLPSRVRPSGYILPGLATSPPLWATLSKCCRSPGCITFRSSLVDRFRAKCGDRQFKLGRLHPVLESFGSISLNTSADIGPVLSNFGPESSKRGGFDRIWPDNGHMWSGFGTFRAVSTDIGRVTAKVGLEWTSDRAMSTEVGHACGISRRSSVAAPAPGVHVH